LGTRMRPLSYATPKELLPVGNRPMIDRAVDEGVRAGVEHIYIITNQQQKAAIETFYRFSDLNEHDQHSRDETKLHFIDQPQQDGIVDAINRARPFLESAPFFLLMPDNVFWGNEPSTQQLLQGLQEYEDTVLGLIEVNKETADFLGNCGKVTLTTLHENVFTVSELKDKKSGRFQLDGQDKAIRACGRFILQPDFFSEADEFDPQVLSQAGEVPIVQRLIQKGRVKGVLLQGHFFDCGNLDGYWKANEHWMKRQRKWS